MPDCKDAEWSSLSVVVADLMKLRLVDLFGPGIRGMGLDNAVGLSGYAATQQLARDLYTHPDAPHGIVYTSRLGPPSRSAVVFFDRAKPHLRGFPGAATLGRPPTAPLPGHLDAPSTRPG